MKVADLYISAIVKANKNKGTQNISLDKYRFVVMFNENQIKRAVDILDNSNDKDLREIQELIISSKPLLKVNEQEDRVTFALPEDYLEISSAYATAKKGCCTVKLKVWESKDQNYNELIEDTNNEPSFDYEETFYNLQGNKIVYFKDPSFEIAEGFLTYYRYPKEIDIEGYIIEDGTPQGKNSTNKESDMNTRFLNKVVSMTVEDFARNNQDVQAVTLNKDRITTDK